MLYGFWISGAGTFCCTVKKKMDFTQFLHRSYKIWTHLLYAKYEKVCLLLFNFPHLPSIPSCTLCFILCLGETAQCCGAASGFIYSSSVFWCKQLPMILAVGEMRHFCAGWKSLLPFLLHMALSLLTIMFKTIWCQQLTSRTAQWACCIYVGWVGGMFSTVLLFRGK